MSWRGFGPEWNGILAVLAIVALALVLVLVLGGWWLALALLVGCVLGLVVMVKL